MHISLARESHGALLNVGVGAVGQGSAQQSCQDRGATVNVVHHSALSLVGGGDPEPGSLSVLGLGGSEERGSQGSFLGS